MFKNILLCAIIACTSLAQSAEPAPTPPVDKITLVASVDGVVITKFNIAPGTLVDLTVTKPTNTKGYWWVNSTADENKGFKASILDGGQDVARYIRSIDTPQHIIFISYHPAVEGLPPVGIKLNYGTTDLDPEPDPNPNPNPNPNPTPTPNPIPVILTPTEVDKSLTSDIPKFMVNTNKKELKEDCISLAVMFNEFANFVANEPAAYTSTQDIQTANKKIGELMFKGKLKDKYNGVGLAVDKSLENKLTLKIENLTPEKRSDAVNILRAIAWQFAGVAKK